MMNRWRLLSECASTPGGNHLNSDQSLNRLSSPLDGRQCFGRFLLREFLPGFAALFIRTQNDGFVSGASTQGFFGETGSAREVTSRATDAALLTAAAASFAQDVVVIVQAPAGVGVQVCQ